jgi:DNA-binding beta-propeller fold protein YncE
MQKEKIDNQKECLECDLPARERLNYFTGQFLAERDFRDEQNYHIGKHRHHNRYLHGWGTVCGLRVIQHPDPACQSRFVIIEPGLAVDCCGREIVVREKVYVDLVKQLAPTNGDTKKPGKHLLISLCYTECKTEYVPALYSECGCDEKRCEPNRVHESFEVKLQLVDKLPEAKPTEPVGVSLKWTTTINLLKASRLALDPKEERLYVMNSEQPGQIMVYDAENHCLLRSINIADYKGIHAKGIDLAISPDGNFLYVIGNVITNNTNDYFLRVIDVKNADQTVNDLPLTPGSQTQLKLAVAKADPDGRVYVLDLNAEPKKVIIWNKNINTQTPTQYASVQTGADPRDIAVSPDGKWLFIAEGATNEIKAAKVDTLTSEKKVFVTIKVPNEKPSLITVSGDSQRLFSVTDKKVHAFSIPQPPLPPAPSFPEIGKGGVQFGIYDPIAIQASPSGKWVYSLLKGSDSEGWVRVVNVEKFETDAAHAVGDPVAVASDPQDLLLDPDGRCLYSAGAGSGQPCGGVSVLDVNEEPCSDIFWRALEGCPECPEDLCVPLAAVLDYKDGNAITDKDIDNRSIRPLAPSTDTLRQAILCALETGTGKRGPEGPRGPAGADGTPGANGSKWFNGNGSGVPAATVGDEGDYYLNTSTGDVYRKASTGWGNPIGNIKGPTGPAGQQGPPGLGLEEGLTQIQALSWKHDTGNNALARIRRSNGLIGGGIVISFGKKPVWVYDAWPPKRRYIDAEHVFQVLVLNPQQPRPEMQCRCPVKGEVFPVEPDGQSYAWKEEQKPFANHVAFYWTTEERKNIEMHNQLWVQLRGDFVLDVQDPQKPGVGKAIDAEYVRAELPTGDRPSPLVNLDRSKFGIQGGLFESWFWIGDKPAPG